MGTSADAAAQAWLPEPTGPRPVGMTSLWLTDTSRPDPWAPGMNARELMVSLWYPATPSNGRRAQYMTPAESELQLTSRGITGVPPDVLSKVRTNAAVDATPAGHGLPLVVLSPGFTSHRNTLTALAEDLASHGYVVAGIDHTYESYATAFPDGRVTTCLAREASRRDRNESVVAGRAADVRFVLDELTGGRPTWPTAGLIDPSRIGMAGRSGRHRHRHGPVRSPVAGHHPRLRPCVLRPAPARPTAIAAGSAVTALPRGDVLFPVKSGASAGSRENVCYLLWLV